MRLLVLIAFIALLITIFIFSRLVNRGSKLWRLNDLNDEKLGLLSPLKRHYQLRTDYSGTAIDLPRGQVSTAMKLLSGTIHTLIEKRGQPTEAIATYRAPEADFEILKKIPLECRGDFPVAQWQVKRIVRNTILPFWRRDIVIYGQNGGEPPTTNDGKLHLVLFGSSQKERSQTRPLNIWGLELPRIAQYNSNPHALRFVDPEDKTCGAELIGNNLYITFDVLQFTAEMTERKRFWRKVRTFLGGRDFHLGLLARSLTRITEELAIFSKLEELLNQSKPVPAERLNATVSASGFDDETIQIGRTARLCDLTSQLLASQLESLAILNGKGQTRQIRETEQFTIYFNAAPKGAIQLPAPDFCWGMPLPANKPILHCISPHGLPIYDDRGIAVGELVGQQLFAYPEFMHYGTAQECLLWANFLLAAREVMEASRLCPDNQSREDYLAGLYGKSLNAHYQHLGNSVSGQSQAALDKSTEAAFGDFARQLRQTVAAQKEMLKIEQAPYLDLGAEFDSLVSISKVVGVRVMEDRLIVNTTDLFCTDPRTKIVHWIGPFEITISTNKITWLNKAEHAQSLKMNAPHVNSSGEACMGNMKDVFSTLITQRQFAACVEAAIAFVEAVNVDDTWGKNINNWPVANSAMLAQNQARG
ncbi:MAG TPA: hypothetical protein PKH78_06745 [Candidatus Obscuribacter sp.]|nr:hypothetical protein [Candidatus Obscuribacter sp.]